MTLKLGNSLLKIKYFKMYVDCSSNVNRGSQLIERHAFEADRLGAKKARITSVIFQIPFLRPPGRCTLLDLRIFSSNQKIIRHRLL